MLWPNMGNREGREGKLYFVWKFLRKTRKKKRVSDTKGFRQQNHLDLKCFERRNLEMEWGESGGNNKQGRRGGNLWLVSNWNLDYSLVIELLNFHWIFHHIEIRVHDEF